MLLRRYYYPIVLSLIAVITSLLFWSVFYLHLPDRIGYNATSLETVFFNYDGPNYLIIAKCWYDKDCISKNFSLPQPLEYYAAHFPGYPLIIKAISFIIPGPKALLLATLTGSIFLTFVFFQFLRLRFKTTTSFWLSLIFLFLPARLFVLRQVGAPETWFIGLTLASIIYFQKKNLILAVVFAALAQTFKSPGILLFFAYGLIAIRHSSIRKYLPFIVVPFTVLIIFYLYQIRLGDFWAYFHSGDNFHLNTLPFLTFISSRSWIGSIWLEDIVYVYLLAIYGVILLFKKYRFGIMAIYPTIFLLATIFVAHRDISRYAAPLYPFLIVAYYRQLSNRYFRLTLFLLLPAIFLYAINFVSGNVAPIADWTPYL